MYSILHGRLGKDSELKEGKSKSFLTFSVAENIGYGDNATTQWVNCVLFGVMAEKLEQYLLKGTEVLVYGHSQLESYKNKDGDERQTLKLIANEVKLLGKPKEEEPKQTEKPAKKYQDDDDIPF